MTHHQNITATHSRTIGERVAGKEQRHVITYVSDDKIVVSGLGRPITVTFQQWLNRTDAAVTTWFQARDAGIKRLSEASSAQIESWNWLHACDFKSVKDLENYTQRRNLFNTSGDMPKTVRCAKCTHVLSDKVSVAIGVGPVCRRKKN